MKKQIKRTVVAVLGCMCLLVSGSVFAGVHNDAADFLVKVGEAHMRSGERADAIHEFSKALMIQPDNEKALANLNKLGIDRGIYKPMRTLLTEFAATPSSDYAGLHRPVDDWYYDDSGHRSHGEKYNANPSEVPFTIKNHTGYIEVSQADRSEPAQGSAVKEQAASVMVSDNSQDIAEALDTYSTLKNAQQLINDQLAQINTISGKNSELAGSLDHKEKENVQLLAEKEVLQLESEMLMKKMSALQESFSKLADEKNLEINDLKNDQMVRAKDVVREEQRDVHALKEEVADLKHELKIQKRDLGQQMKEDQSEVARLDDENKALKAVFEGESKYEKELSANSRRMDLLESEATKIQLKDADMLQVFEDYLYLRHDEAEGLKNEVILGEMAHLQDQHLLLAKANSLVDAQQSIAQHRSRADELNETLTQKNEMIKEQNRMIIETGKQLDDLNGRAE